MSGPTVKQFNVTFVRVPFLESAGPFGS